MPIHTIAFSVQAEPITDSTFNADGVETPVELRLLRVTVLVDGVPLFRQLQSAVSVDDLLATANLPAGVCEDLVLLTCSCGIPGCAGYHNDPTVEVTLDAVRWHLPSTGYEHAVSKHFGLGPWVLSFDRQQYRQALEALIRELATLREQATAQGQACHHFPADVGPEFELVPFEVVD